MLKKGDSGRRKFSGLAGICPDACPDLCFRDRGGLDCTGCGCRVVRVQLLDESKNHIYEKKYKMFHKLFEEQDEIPDYRMYMADGFRESHGYTENGEIETIRNAEHTGILLLFEFPQSVDLEINEEKIYAIVWEYLMKLQEELPRALMYYGKRDEHGIEKHTSKLGIFLPFCHFEREMEKNIELANGIGLGCRETILAEMKVLEK